jgi:hypothetical protein
VVDANDSSGGADDRYQSENEENGLGGLEILTTFETPKASLDSLT